ncbi:hypothetical protein [Burkholderia cenocepacia]|uniref:Uncharacterized protein n=1 Tax=Burkholderia cenocepacia TaxID=95486 RepID=A0A3S9NDC4_9BURK|nr:hypothetical protein [Burkholderia cenocepacia]AZQ53789.1 hypothetical protein D5R55_23080 [Burkholderia cenocepacia]
MQLQLQSPPTLNEIPDQTDLLFCSESPPFQTAMLSRASPTREANRVRASSLDANVSAARLSSIGEREASEPMQSAQGIKNAGR